MIMKSAAQGLAIFLLFYLAILLVGPGSIPFISRDFFTDLGMLSLFFLIFQYVILYHFH